MRFHVALPSLLGLTLLASAVAADPKGDAKVASKGNKEIRRDPEGKRGISPYMELVVKGDSSFVARDLPGAVSAYQDAIKADAQKTLAFYRLGEVFRDQGKFDDAEAAWQSALSKKGSDDLTGKVLFCLAELREREHKWQPAKDAWSAYSAFVTSHPKAVGFPASAIDRQKQIDRRMQLEVDYGKVKDRIAKRIAEKEAEALENAKKDKLNR